MGASAALVSVLTVLLVPGANSTPAAGQAASAQGSPVSIERVRTGVLKPRTLELVTIPLLPVATFQTRVEEVRFVLTFEERLREEFEPTILQRQSRDWGSRCCGIDLGAVFGPIDRALQARRERKIRKQIARELEALRTAAGRR